MPAQQTPGSVCVCQSALSLRKRWCQEHGIKAVRLWPFERARLSVAPEESIGRQKLEYCQGLGHWFVEIQMLCEPVDISSSAQLPWARTSFALQVPPTWCPNRLCDPEPNLLEDILRHWRTGDVVFTKLIHLPLSSNDIDVLHLDSKRRPVPELMP